MITVYGSLLCKDCVACKAAFEEKGVEFTYRDFSEELSSLKTFLSLRDSEPVFAPVKGAGKIGIPCLVLEDGSVTLDWEQFV